MSSKKAWMESVGVTKAAVRYHTNRQYIYRWMKRYNGTLHSLENRSHRPHRHPNQHTPEEIKLILNMRRRNTNAGIVVFLVKLRSRGYTRSISGLYRFLRKRNSMAVKLPNPNKYTPKPYEQMSYPGQRVQIDVKFVPKTCIVGQEEPTQWYQYTFIDEYTRFRYLEAFPEHSAYSFQHCVKRFPTPSNVCRQIMAANSQIGWSALKIPSQRSLKKPWSSLIFVTS